MALPKWTIGKFYRRRWGGRAEYMGSVVHFPENFPNEKVDFSSLKDDELACPVFSHRDLGNFYVHNLDGTMKRCESAHYTNNDRETLAAYAIVESD